MKKIFDYLPHIFFALSIFFLGVFIGIEFQKQNTQLKISPINIPEKELSSVITLTQISPFGIKGSVSGNSVRFVHENDVLEVKKDEQFQWNTANIFKNIALSIPENAKFFASSRGKKVYDVSNTKQLEKITPENIVFFSSLEEAKNAGYHQ